MSASNYFCVYVFPYSVFMWFSWLFVKHKHLRGRHAEENMHPLHSGIMHPVFSGLFSPPVIFTAAVLYGQRCISLEMSPVCLLHTCTADPNQTLSATPTSTITSNLPKCRETLYRTPHSQFLKRKAAEAWERTNPLTEAYQAQSTNAISADLESLRPFKDEHVHAFPSLSFN